MLFYSSLRPVLASVAALVAIALSPIVHAADEIYETAAVGTNVSFSASADGYPAPTFKWMKDGIAIPGATNITLLLPNVTTASSGVYNAIATNSAGYALSNDLVLTVSVAAQIGSAPYFTVQPYPSASAPAGTSLTLSATAVGSPAPTYQWRKNGVAIASATNSTLTLSSLTTNDSATYSVVATNSAGSATSGNSVLTVLASPSQAVAPVILSQPVSTSVPKNGDAAFKIAASGTPAPTFQWYKNGAPIAGATNSYLSLVSVNPSDAGNYSVVAKNSAGSVTSNNALLSVSATSPSAPQDPVVSVPSATAPTILSQPLSQTVAAGGTAAFKIAASGTPTPTLQWYKNGVPLSGATNSDLTLVGLTANDIASYWVVATNSAGAVTSSSAFLSVSAQTPSIPQDPVVSVPSATAPVILSQPLSQTVAEGGTAAFKIAASGTPAPTFQWYKNGVPLSGATNSYLTLVSLTANDIANYSVVATNSAGSVTSSSAFLNVVAATPTATAPIVSEPTTPTAPVVSAPTGTAPVILSQPASQTVVTQGSVAFKIAASGTPAPTFQWYKDGAAIPDATNSWYAISGVTSSQAGIYTVVATNSAGSATSNGATLSVTQ